MKIIDKRTGKRIGKPDNIPDPSLKKTDPLQRHAEKEEIAENSPMQPPEAYEATTLKDVDKGNMDEMLRKYMDEHRRAEKVIDRFDKALTKFKSQAYALDQEINASFGEFFQFFDNDLLDHNRREERELFTFLHHRLIEVGECGNGLHPRTAVDLMEDDHVKFIQLGTLSFNLLGLAARLEDTRSRTFVYDVAFDNARELTEMLRLHIYREDEVVFPLAHKHIAAEEWQTLRGEPK